MISVSCQIPLLHTSTSNRDQCEFCPRYQDEYIGHRHQLRIWTQHEIQQNNEESQKSKDEVKKLGFSLGDEGPERSMINQNEFYCLDGGFASHLPKHYKVLFYFNS